MELKDKLLELRKKNRLSQQELADQLNVSRQSISKWELGETQPDINNIIALSDIYNVSTDYLLKDTIINTMDDSKDNSQLVIIITTIVILLGALTGRVLWGEYQNAISLLVGIIIQIIGVGIFECYAIYTHHNEAQKLFFSINIWLITLLPIYYFVEYTTTYQFIY
ncbi:MAG: helix-turn-helix transcriptional regulator, partial [Coprobacillus sp.]